MLQKCQKEGTVVKLTTLHEEHFKGADAKAVAVPYFEGDHWIMEAEAILKALEDEKDSRVADKDGKQKKSKKVGGLGGDAKAKGRGLRSDGDVEELNGRDPLVVRMGKTLEPMRDAFIVAYLHDRQFAADKWAQRVLELEEEEAAAAAGQPLQPSSRADPAAADAEDKAVGGAKKVAGGKFGGATAGTSLSSSAPVVGASAKGSAALPPAAPTSLSASVVAAPGLKREPCDDAGASPSPPGSALAPVKSEESVVPAPPTSMAMAVESSGSGAGDGGSQAASPPPPPSSMDVDPALGRSTTADGEGAGGGGGDDQPSAGQVKQEVEAAEARAEAAEVAKVAGYGRPSDELDDLDEQIESEIFDTRQQFLNLCQGNHYQFDQLRRAKHTSMMALYHVHNPDIPKFLTSCSSCGIDIISG
jgi:E1A/CREB-binding protein